jgi:hypothetical protein
MALREYQGMIIMEVDGVEVEVETLNITKKSGRKVVKVMNKTGRATGFTRGIADIDIDCSAVIPLTGDLAWGDIVGAKITVYPLGGGQRVSYLDCFTTEVGKKYKVDGEAKQDLKMVALREVLES